MNIHPTFAVAALALPFLLLTSGCDWLNSRDLNALQGTWTGTAKGESGDCKVVVTGRQIRFEGPEGGSWYEGTIALQPGDNPKRLSATVTGSSVEKHVGKTAGFLYRIADGTLTIASLAPGQSAYPQGFEDPSARLFTLKKQGS